MTDEWRQEQNGLAPLAPAFLSSRAMSDRHQSLVGMSARDPGMKRGCDPQVENGWSRGFVLVSQAVQEPPE